MRLIQFLHINMGQAMANRKRICLANCAIDTSRRLIIFIITFPYNARFDSLKQRTLSENKEQVSDIKLAFKFLLRNFDKSDPN